MLLVGRFWRTPETLERELNFLRKCSRRLGESARADLRRPTIVIVGSSRILAVCSQRLVGRSRQPPAFAGAPSGPVRDRVAPLAAASAAVAFGPPALADEIGDAAKKLVADSCAFAREVGWKSGVYLQAPGEF